MLFWRPTSANPLAACPRPCGRPLRLGAYQICHTRVPHRSAVHESVTLVAARYGRLRALVNAVLRRLARAQDAASDPAAAPIDASASRSDCDARPTPHAGAGAAESEARAEAKAGTETEAGAENEACAAAQAAALTAAADRNGLPPWLLADVAAQRGGAGARAWADSHAEVPATGVRVNRRRSDPAQVQAALARTGAQVRAAPGAWPDSLLLRRGGAVQDLPGFAAGHWSVQDLAATAVGQLLALAPEATLVDLCAAPGGKAAHLAERMDDRGHILALDVHPHRVRLIDATCQRLGLTSVQALCADGRDVAGSRDLLRQNCGRDHADAVLVDAPCSGLGILRRHRERLQRAHRPETGDPLCTLQAALLRAAAALLAPGGQLVYAVCTPTQAEGPQQRDAFLAAQPEFELVPLPTALQPFAASGGGLQLWSDRHGTDSFFAFCARRRGPSAAAAA